MTQYKLITTDASKVKKACIFHNTINTIDVYRSIATPYTYVYIPYILGINTPVVASVPGYTKLLTSQPSTKHFRGLDAIIDFTNAGSNTNVPEITDYEFGSEPAELNNRFWVQPVIVNDIKVGERFALYNKNEPAPTGACFNQNTKWSDAEYLTYNTIKLTHLGENLIL